MRIITPHFLFHRPFSISSHSMFFACTCKSNCTYMYKQLLLHVQAKNMLWPVIQFRPTHDKCRQPTAWHDKLRENNHLMKIIGVR